MRTFTFIVNPNAGGGKPRKLLPEIERLLRSWDVPYTLKLTTGRYDATRLALASDSDVVVAVGGDGTVNEVANGLRPGATLGVIPAGSGNDLVKSLPIPVKPLDALRTAVQGRPMRMDVGKVSCSHSGAAAAAQGETRFFLNGVGVGFDAEVAVRKERIRFLSGTPVYVAAVLQTLGRYRAPLFDIQADGVTRSSRQLLIAVGNGRCAGGGFYLTPDADPSDGRLDVCLIDDVSVFTILRLMPRVMKGKHLGHPSVTLVRSSRVALESATPFYVHADGEIVGNLVTKVEISLRTQPLTVLGG